MARKKHKKGNLDQQPATGSAQRYSNPNIGLARLFEFLGSCRSFPVSIKTAACVSGIPEEEVRRVLQGSLYYFIWKDEISNSRTA